MKKLLVLALACVSGFSFVASAAAAEVRRSYSHSSRETVREHRSRGGHDRSAWRGGRGGDYHHRRTAWRGDRPRYHAPRSYHYPRSNYYYPRSYSPYPRTSYYYPGYVGLNYWSAGPRYSVGYGYDYGYRRPYYRGYYNAGYATGGDATTAGTLLGAGLGAVIGHDSGRGVAGAIIGGLLGALVGSAVDDSNSRPRYRSAIAPQSSVYDSRASYQVEDAPSYAPPAVQPAITTSTQREFRRPAVTVSRASFSRN